MIAAERVYNSNGGSDTLMDFKLDLFLSQIALSTTEDRTMTLEALGCNATLENPLEVFVVPRNLVEIDDKPHTLWKFPCSNRGIATFTTCLKVLMAEVHNKPTVFRKFLKVLYEITHFPPALLALNALATHNKLVRSAVLILGTCFRELALRMVPGCLIGNKLESALEGSRQIFAWASEQCGHTSDEAMDDPLTALVRAVQFEELKPDSMEYFAAAGKSPHSAKCPTRAKLLQMRRSRL